MTAGGGVTMWDPLRFEKVRESFDRSGRVEVG